MRLERHPPRSGQKSDRPKKSKNRFHYSFLKILSGSDLSRRRLPYMIAESSKPGPNVWLTACSHGDEVGGVVVVQEVFKYLRRTPLTKGTLHAFPLMNPLGFEVGTRHVSLSEEDLNRSFPGNPAGTLAERIADRIFHTVIETKPSLVLDLHNDWIRSIPYTVLDPPPGNISKELIKKIEGFAQTTGFLIVSEQDALRKTLSYSLVQEGIPALTIELGESYVVNEKNVNFGMKSIINVLRDLGMIEPESEPFRYPVPEEVSGKRLKYSNQPISSTSGILRFSVGVGDLVRSGQPVAKIYNAFGRLQETLLADADGIVLGISDSSVAFPGAPVMAFGIL